jgi:hypothetical protein
MYSRMTQEEVAIAASASRPSPTIAMVMVALATYQACLTPRVLRTSTNTGTKIDDRIPPRTSS